MLRDLLIGILILSVGLVTIVGLVSTNTPGIVLAIGVTIIIFLAWIFKL